jgi:hypothetical protein
LGRGIGSRSDAPRWRKENTILIESAKNNGDGGKEVDNLLKITDGSSVGGNNITKNPLAYGNGNQDSPVERENIVEEEMGEGEMEAEILVG